MDLTFHVLKEESLISLRYIRSRLRDVIQRIIPAHSPKATLPKGGEDFLDVALKTMKKRGIIHFYDFLSEDQFKLGKAKVKKACKLLKKKCRILKLVKCGQQSPRIYRICVDVKITW